MAQKLRGSQQPKSPYSPISISREDMMNNPLRVGTTTTVTGPNSSQGTQIGSSFNKMFGEGPSSMPDLEAASMRLADAASRRNIAEKEAEQDLQARMMGYSNFASYQSDMMRKRLLSKQADSGYSGLNTFNFPGVGESVVAG